MDLKTIMLGYIAKQHSITEEAAAELLFKKSEDGEALTADLKDDALTAILSLDKTRITAVKEAEKTASYNTAFANAKTEILPKVEKKLAKKFGIELKDLKLDALVDKIVESKVSEAGKGSKDSLTENDIKKLPLYLALEAKSVKDLQDLQTNHTTALKDIETASTKAATFEKASELILGHLTAMNPVFSTTATVAKTQQTDFIAKFKNYSFEAIAGSKDFLTLNAEGKRVEDGHGNLKTLKTLTEDAAKLSFDFKKQAGKESSGNSGTAGGAVVVPADQAAYDLAVISAPTAEARTAIVDAWTAVNK